MQQPLIPEPAPQAQKPRSCAIYYCDHEALGSSPFCGAHQPVFKARLRCPSCNSGAVMEAGGKYVCSTCGYGRRALPRAPKRRAK